MWQMVLAHILVKGWIICPYVQGLFMNLIRFWSSLPKMEKLSMVTGWPEMLIWSCIGEGDLRCSLNLSSKFLADSPIYSWSQSTLPHLNLYMTPLLLRIGSLSLGAIRRFLMVWPPFRCTSMPYFDKFSCSSHSALDAKVPLCVFLVLCCCYWLASCYLACSSFGLFGSWSSLYSMMPILGICICLMTSLNVFFIFQVILFGAHRSCPVIQCSNNTILWCDGVMTIPVQILVCMCWFSIDLGV